MEGLTRACEPRRPQTKPVDVVIQDFIEAVQQHS